MPPYRVTERPGIDDPLVVGFISQVGPKVYERLGIHPLCVISIGSGGRVFGAAMYIFLAGQEVDGNRGVDVEYNEANERTCELRNPVDPRRIKVFIDDNFSSGATLRRFRERYPGSVFVGMSDPYKRADISYDFSYDLPARRGRRNLRDLTVRYLAYLRRPDAQISSHGEQADRAASNGNGDHDPDVTVNLRIEGLPENERGSTLKRVKNELLRGVKLL